ncbi:MAG TPA: SUMF1/EgtB/PvdO family nonheme iron enzyme [Nitrospiraceae bacterium]|nr:SUMF1/EgtB/PvdO family nonheme iron enzyme [Nitrospiraceae bacterium]
MALLSTPRSSLHSMNQARIRTDALFALLRPTALYHRPVAERHRLIFYLGHLEAFDWNLIAPALGLPAFHPDFDRLFAFGIDPEPGQLPQDAAADWPESAEVHRYNAQVRRTLDSHRDEIPADLLRVAIEHRLMHAETFAYLLHHVAFEYKHSPARSLPSPIAPCPVHRLIDIPEGQATLGKSRTRPSETFGWDNEYDEHAVTVPAFAITKYKVTNGQYLEFVRAGAPAPHFWIRHGSDWHVRTMFGEIPLPLDWPVYVTQGEAQAYAGWADGTLPTETQFHRAAYGTPNGDERRYPWGDAPPDASRGNFDFRFWDPISVSASPLGDSAFGVSQLVGNGWEWTSTVFEPFPGFETFPFYPGYSAPFFDGAHYVMKGGSSQTASCLLRRSFRNWFRSDYPYAYAGFRVVHN